MPTPVVELTVPDTALALALRGRGRGRRRGDGRCSQAPEKAACTGADDSPARIDTTEIHICFFL